MFGCLLGLLLWILWVASLVFNCSCALLFIVCYLVVYLAVLFLLFD